MEPRHILVILPTWVGDVVMATPALRSIRARYPSANITYLQRPNLVDLLAGCPWFDRVESWPPRGWSGLAESAALIRRLRAARFDLAVLFPNSFRTAFVAFLARAKRRVGFDRDGRGLLLTERLKPLRRGRAFVPAPMLDYYRQLVRAIDCPDDDERLELHATPRDVATLDARLNTDDGRPIAVLNPGASYGVAKCWPAHRYAALADGLTERLGLHVVVTCGPAERDVADRFRAAARRPYTLFVDPPLGLGPLKALVQRARIMVTNDTGPRHFAAAFNVPVVTIFGSSDPAWTECRHPLERKVMTKLDCQPCMKRVCPLGHHNCMNQIDVELVMAAVDELLERGRHDARPVEMRA
ncbi:MAG: lipopolysaccharide heptosyltransferase II [Phycisphaerae bacterium]|nr:lipopolysaccharide heptosyltransferase II [Phycisphaerae bacterium]NUQ47604.1 lipopolysaccharide heptosyltransferase II [Phycisphaerae bacterium]